MTNQWISVNDRLPRELNERVLVIDEVCEISIGVLINEETKRFDSHCRYDITHWMDLPAPPDRGK